MTVTVVFYCRDFDGVEHWRLGRRRGRQSADGAVLCAAAPAPNATGAGAWATLRPVAPPAPAPDQRTAIGRSFARRHSADSRRGRARRGPRIVGTRGVATPGAARG